MKHPLFVAIGAGVLWLLSSGVGYDAQAAQSPLVADQMPQAVDVAIRGHMHESR